MLTNHHHPKVREAPSFRQRVPGQEMAECPPPPVVSGDSASHCDFRGHETHMPTGTRRDPRWDGAGEPPYRLLSPDEMRREENAEKKLRGERKRVFKKMSETKFPERIRRRH